MNFIILSDNKRTIDLNDFSLLDINIVSLKNINKLGI